MRWLLSDDPGSGDGGALGALWTCWSCNGLVDLGLPHIRLELDDNANAVTHHECREATRRTLYARYGKEAAA